MAPRGFRGWMAAVLLSGAWVGALAVGDAGAAEQKADSYEVLYARYLAAARQMGQRQPGSLSIDWMAGLASDPRARNVNDLVTVRVIESIVGTGRADSTLDKESSAHASVSNLFGLETLLPDEIDPTNLINSSSDTAFKGGGRTTRSSELMATMTARVVEVLPNGDLVLEGARELDINGDRQIVVLTGVIRPADVSRTNVVLSTSIGQLSIRYFGRGLIKDNLKPGWLVRVLNKIF